ncbi:patj homolog isoform X2 [Drosophila elegans]|uniref:patj homolog isoform X2 n=1 Tax=Drosophila elegans TaxID=30023 RepID=UPI0007E82B52|nr:patj homolog isoform X2 [Drosophila elegans]
MVLSTEWSQVEVIDLINDGNGLGFILVGGRSTGVVIKALTPGGVAERDGRLQLGDHLLQIGEVTLRGYSSEQVATVLRQTGAQVRLIVARPVEPTAIDYQTLACQAPIIPTKLLSDPEELSRHLFQNPSFATAAAAAAAASAAAAAAAAAGSSGGAGLDVASLVGLVRGGPVEGSELSAVEPAQLQISELGDLADFPLPPIPGGNPLITESNASQRPCPRLDLDIVPFSILSPPPRPALQLLPLETQWRSVQDQHQHIETVIADSKRKKLLANENGGSASESGSGSGSGSGSPDDSYMDSPETETYVVELHKNVYGLGITVAGYVCEEEDLSGIFVKSIIEGSAAETSGQIQINDRIVAVDGRSLSGVTNHQAVELLRNTDIVVHLTLERFLRGRKFEHLQVALTEIKGSSARSGLDRNQDKDADQESQLSMPGSPSIATLSWLPPKSLDADSIATEGDEVVDAEDVVVSGAEDVCLELPSRDTVESNMSHVLDRSDHSGGGVIRPKISPIAPLTNGRSVNLADDSGNDTDEQCPEPEAEMEMETATARAKKVSKPESERGIKELEDLDTDPGQMPTPTNEAPVKVASPTAASLRVAWKSLGISLEGTVDVECGIEKRPHHYIRSILADGPVGRQGILRPGDELLQVNEHKLQGLRHTDVVKILKELPASVKLVCARGTRVPSVINTSQNPEAFETRSLLPGGHQSLQNLLSKAQSESSLYTSSTATLTDAGAAGGGAGGSGGNGAAGGARSKSLENVSGLALWSCEVTAVDIEKTEQGFGFSILDYQDPLDSEGSVIVIRGLIRGGAAEATNEIYPGDRLMSVGDRLLQGLELDEAVSILKAVPPGLTRLGICRPLSASDSNSNSNIASPLGDSAST